MTLSLSAYDAYDPACNDLGESDVDEAPNQRTKEERHDADVCPRCQKSWIPPTLSASWKKGTRKQQRSPLDAS